MHLYHYTTKSMHYSDFTKPQVWGRPHMAHLLNAARANFSSLGLCKWEGLGLVEAI